MEKEKKILLSGDKIIIEEIKSKSGEKSYRHYEKGKFLGKGGFAKCIELIQCDNRKLFAAKVISKSTLQKSRSKQKLMSEIKIHKHLKNENIVNFEHFFEDSENVYILLELCQNQTLNELLRRRKRLTELEIKCYIVQILNALIFIHSNHIIHRDLKLSNLFLSNHMEIKVGDFGLATKVSYEGERKKTVCGTPNYIAPEILESKSGGHSYEADVWSLGVIIYTLLIGKPPFETSDVKKTYRKIKANDYIFPENVIISVEARNLIESLLVLDPTQRLSLENIYEHDFLSDKAKIPKSLPSSTLACPPSVSYLKKLMPNKDYSFELPNQNKLIAENTAPLIAINENKTKGKGDFRLTERRASESVNTLPGNKKQEFLTNYNNNKFFNNHDNVIKNNAKENIDKPNVVGKIESLINPEQKKLKKMNSPQISLNKERNETPSKKKTDIYIEEFLDYSFKYGLGYLLNNGTYGVCFNDSTKIFCSILNNKISYIFQKDAKKEDCIQNFTTDNYPIELEKKVTLLGYFKKYLELEEKQKNFEKFKEKNLLGEENFIVYLKKWKKAHDSILFRLSNKLYQVFFKDKTQIILCSETRSFIFKNEIGEKKILPISASLKSGDGNEEIIKKIKFVKDLLTAIYTNNIKTIKSNKNKAFESNEEKKKKGKMFKNKELENYNYENEEILFYNFQANAN